MSVSALWLYGIDSDRRSQEQHIHEEPDLFLKRFGRTNNVVFGPGLLSSLGMITEKNINSNHRSQESSIEDREGCAPRRSVGKGIYEQKDLDK